MGQMRVKVGGTEVTMDDNMIAVRSSPRLVRKLNAVEDRVDRGESVPHGSILGGEQNAFACRPLDEEQATLPQSLQSRLALRLGELFERLAKRFREAANDGGKRQLIVGVADRGHERLR